MDKHIQEYPCAACGYLTITGPYDICPVCFWQCDPDQEDNPDFVGAPNHVSLRHAQQYFCRFGVISEKYLDLREGPRDEYKRDPKFKPLEPIE